MWGIPRLFFTAVFALPRQVRTALPACDGDEPGIKEWNRSDYESGQDEYDACLEDVPPNIRCGSKTNIHLRRFLSAFVKLLYSLVKLHRDLKHAEEEESGKGESEEPRQADRPEPCQEPDG